jgi:glycosyltransferase involved in cell wall biosynthesis
MGRFVGYRGRTIRLVSDQKISSGDGISVIEVPSTFDEFPDHTLMERFIVRAGALVDREAKLEPKSARVALVGVYQEHCGISTYAEALWPHIAATVGHAAIFCEEGTPESTGVIPCWKRGQPLMRLVNEIKQYDPDVVMIQHEFGLFPDARHWLAFLSALRDYRVIVTMHSVFKHKDKTICEAAIPEIIVHTELAANVLKNEKQIPGKVHVIPHGCSPYTNGEKYWNLYRSKHTFTQFGFGFRYKAWETCIRATAELKTRIPDVFFTALFSESPYCKVEHDVYAEELHELIEALGVQENVAIVRGYQSDQTLASYLRTNQIAVFPYSSSVEHQVFGCSGAARLAMSHGIPIIGSAEPHFHDLQGVIPRASSIQDVVESLETLFKDAEARKSQLARQAEFLRENSWAAVARRHLEIL